ncbi:MAG: regulatory protein RecX [Lachnospiraceae bacterium]|nr:regulatory protein RecX [Lachnospiraceae bacterium]
MTVTGIEAISKTRSRVYLDGDFTLVLYKGELRKYQIVEGKELAEETLQELEKEVLPKRARARAMNLLKSRRYTEKQLTDKLLAGGYSRELAENALAYVKSYHYVDDARYAYDYVVCHMERSSMKEIEQKLMQKGIDREITRAAAQELAENGMLAEEETMIRRLLEKKHYDLREADEKQKQRIYGYFYRKGFSLQTVRRVIEESFT